LLPLRGLSEESAHSPRAVSDFLMERLILGGATRICFVISPEKSDILQYYSRSSWETSICYTVQREPAGLCDAIFHAIPFIDADEPVLVGLPDTIWFPEDGFCHLADDRFSFLLFPVAEPQFFDSVEMDTRGAVTRIRVKDIHSQSNQIWGAFKMPGYVFRELHELWLERGRSDEYIGTLVNEWIERGGEAWGVAAGATYCDVGTMRGYIDAMRFMTENSAVATAGRTLI
jgi:dTDP-glucose pyrophosphorylase